MRSVKLAGRVLGLCLFAACGADSGLLDLTLSADTQSPPPQAVVVDLVGSGGIRRTYAGKFPPDSATLLRLQYPNLPAGTSTFSVQTLDADGCVVGKSPTPFDVAIKAGAKVTAMTSVRRSAVPCGDGGVPVFDSGADVALSGDLGGADVAAVSADAPMDTAPAVDLPPSIDAAPAPSSLDVAATEAISVDLAPAITSLDAGADAPLPAAPTIISFTASPPTISAGSRTTLTAVFKNAVGSSIDHGIGSVTSGNGVSSGPLTTTTTFQLTISDASGNTASQTVKVTVVPLPNITSFTALMPTIASGTLTELTAVFTGGTGSIDNSIGPIVSGVGVPTGVLYANTTFSLTVTNPAGDTATKQATVTTSTAVGAGAFTPTGSMAIPRTQHTATLLPNGKVLVAGGSNTDTRAELYDPTNGKFSVAGSLTTWRVGHTATLLQNGKVLIVGGNDATTEIYDPTSGIFSPSGNASDARVGHTATLLLDGRVLVGGGGGSSTGYLASAELYDPAKGTFSPTGEMSNPRLFATANLLPNGMVLVAGGCNVTNIPPRGKVATADVYAVLAGAFSATGLMSYGRCAHTSVSLQNGSILILGGEGDSGPTQYAELYDPIKGQFSVSGLENEERYRHATALLPNGNVLVSGGDLLNTATASADVYAVTSGRFTSTGTMSAGRELHSATLLPNGRVLVAGGDLDGTAELYW